METTAAPSAQLAYVPVERIDPPPTNCRAELGDIDDLARSIRTHGLLTPLRLRLLADGRYEIVAGERRWRAAQLVGLTEVPAAIDTDCDEVSRIGAQLAENTDRLQLREVEQLAGIQQLLELGLGDDDVAVRAGLEVAEICVLRRIKALPAAVQELLAAGELTVNQAAQLAALEEPEVVEEVMAEMGQGYSLESALRSAPDQVRRRRIADEARARLTKAGVRIIDPPSGYDFTSSSTTRRIGRGASEVNVDVRKHRKEPCHAAYLSPWARSAKDAVTYVCTDVRRHAGDVDAGVPGHLALSPEDVKQERAEKRAQKKAWRLSHSGRRHAAGALLASLSEGEAIARITEQLVLGEHQAAAALIAAELLGNGDVSDLDAPVWLAERLRNGDPAEQLRVAVACLMARAERAFANEHGDWKERDNVRAHLRQLTAHGYVLDAGEGAHLERTFQLETLEPVPAFAWRRAGVAGDDGDDVDGGAAGVEADEPQDEPALPAEVELHSV